MPVSYLVKHEMRVPADRFRWRSSDGEFHTPISMATRHLFFTIRMIWNHSMPKDAWIEPYRRHRFSSFYTRDYMITAVRVMLPILINRGDLRPEWKAQLAFMAWYLRNQEMLLPPVVLKLAATHMLAKPD